MMMDASVVTYLLLAFIAALVISVHETKASLAAPACKYCVHCQSLARDKALKQEELRELYSRRGQRPERDDDTDKPR